MRANKLKTATIQASLSCLASSRIDSPMYIVCVRVFHMVVCSCRPHAVSERLVCHAIIGKNAHKERIMTVDVTANFIAPLTQFNTREISFTTYQVYTCTVHVHLHDKQTPRNFPNTQHNSTIPEEDFLQRKISCLRWDSNP